MASWRACHAWAFTEPLTCTWRHPHTGLHMACACAQRCSSRRLAQTVGHSGQCCAVPAQAALCCWGQLAPVCWLVAWRGCSGRARRAGWAADGCSQSAAGAPCRGLFHWQVIGWCTQLQSGRLTCLGFFGFELTTSSAGAHASLLLCWLCQLSLWCRPCAQLLLLNALWCRGCVWQWQCDCQERSKCCSEVVRCP